MTLTRWQRLRHYLRAWYEHVRSGGEPPSDRILLGGQIHVEVWDADTGELLECRVAVNRQKDDLFKSYVDQVDPNASGTEAKLSDFGVGTDGSDSVTGFLGSEISNSPYPLSKFENKGRTFIATGLLAESEANGTTIREVGLTDSSTGQYYNRGVIEPAVDKTDQIEVTFTFDSGYFADGT